MNYEYGIVWINMKSMVKFAPTSTKLDSCRKRCLCPVPSRNEIAEDKPWKLIFLSSYFLIHYLVCVAAFFTMEWLFAEDELFSWTVSIKALPKVNGDGEGSPAWGLLQKYSQLLIWVRYLSQLWELGCVLHIPAAKQLWAILYGIFAVEEQEEDNTQVNLLKTPTSQPLKILLQIIKIVL